MVVRKKQCGVFTCTDAPSVTPVEAAVAHCLAVQVRFLRTPSWTPSSAPSVPRSCGGRCMFSWPNVMDCLGVRVCVGVCARARALAGNGSS